jgi:hypothetical protein
VTYALIGIAALLICLTAIGLIYRDRNGTIMSRRRLVVCNLDNGHAIRGVLDSVHTDVLVLSAASMLGHEITDMAGRVLVPRHRVLWVQEPGQALSAPGDAA